MNLGLIWRKCVNLVTFSYFLNQFVFNPLINAIFTTPQNPFTISKLYFTTLFAVKSYRSTYLYFTTFSCLASLFVDVLASLIFADMDNGGRDDEEFIFISLRAGPAAWLPNRIYIFIIDQPHLCFRLDTIE